MNFQYKSSRGIVIVVAARFIRERISDCVVSAGNFAALSLLFDCFKAIKLIAADPLNMHGGARRSKSGRGQHGEE